MKNIEVYHMCLFSSYLNCYNVHILPLYVINHLKLIVRDIIIIGLIHNKILIENKFLNDLHI